MGKPRFHTLGQRADKPRPIDCLCQYDRAFSAQYLVSLFMSDTIYCVLAGQRQCANFVSHSDLQSCGRCREEVSSAQPARMRKRSRRRRAGRPQLLRLIRPIGLPTGPPACWENARSPTCSERRCPTDAGDERVERREKQNGRPGGRPSAMLWRRSPDSNRG